MMVNRTQLPEGWQWVRLGDVAEVGTGGTPSRSESAYWSGSIPWMASGEINQRRVQATAEQITTEGLKNSNAKLFPPGTVMVAMNGQGATRGKACVLDIEAACNQSLAAVRSGRYSRNSFLFHVLDSAYEELRSITGDGRNGLNLTLVRTFRLPLPPLSEQRAIAAVLDSIDDAIERTEAVIAATEQLRDAMLHELLTRGVPGWHMGWKDVPGIGTIPACWDVVRLGEGVTHVGSGVTPRGGKSAYAASGIPFLRSQNVHFDGLSLGDVVYIPSEVDDSMHRSRVQPGDVLLNITGASIGRCTIAPIDLGPANVNQHVCIIRTTEEFNPRFVWKWLSTPRSQREIDEIQTGQSRQGLNYQQVRQLTIARPPRTEQDSIVEMLRRLDATLEAVRQERDGLQPLKASAADVLLTGRVRVELGEKIHDR